MELKEALYLRTGILEDNHVIDKKVADYTRKVIDMILEEKPDVSQDKAEMFFTHLAMAGKRVVEGTEENPIEAGILEEMREEPVFEAAEDFRNRMLKETDLEFPDAEKDFLIVHLCNLLG